MKRTFLLSEEPEAGYWWRNTFKDSDKSKNRDANRVREGDSAQLFNVLITKKSTCSQQLQINCT